MVTDQATLLFKSKVVAWDFDSRENCMSTRIIVGRVITLIIYYLYLYLYLFRYIRQMQFIQLAEQQ
jgi:hypothetical protein